MAEIGFAIKSSVFSFERKSCGEKVGGEVLVSSEDVMIIVCVWTAI